MTFLLTHHEPWPLAHGPSCLIARGSRSSDQVEQVEPSYAWVSIRPSTEPTFGPAEAGSHSHRALRVGLRFGSAQEVRRVVLRLHASGDVVAVPHPLRVVQADWCTAAQHRREKERL